MPRALSLLSLLLVLVAPGAVAAEKPRLRFEFRASEIGNLARHLECLAEVAFCDTAVYRGVWRAGWSPADDAAIGRWRTLTEKYAGLTLDPNRAGALAAPHAFEYAEVELRAKLRIAALGASSLADYADRLALVVLPADVGELVGVMQHFAPRFRAYWRNGPERAAAAFARQFKTHVARPDVAALLEKAATFYGAQLPDGHPAVFHMIYRPKSTERHSFAELLENHSLIEFVDGEKAADRVAVVLHELFHYLYYVAPAARHRDRVLAFGRSSDPMAYGYYNLLNEGLAAALGNGLVERLIAPRGFDAYLAKPLSFVSDTFKDRAAKALLPLVVRYLDRGATMDDAFVTEAIIRIRKGLGEFQDAPLLLMRIGSVVADGPDLKSLRRHVQRAVIPVSLSSYSDFDSSEVREEILKFPEQSVLIFIRPERLPRLRAWERVVGKGAVQALAGAKQVAPYIFGVRRTPRSAIYVFVARTPDEFRALLTRYVGLRRGFEGFGPPAGQTPLAPTVR